MTKFWFVYLLNGYICLFVCFLNTISLVCILLCEWMSQQTYCLYGRKSSLCVFFCNPIWIKQRFWPQRNLHVCVRPHICIDRWLVNDQSIQLLLKSFCNQFWIEKISKSIVPIVRTLFLSLRIFFSSSNIPYFVFWLLTWCVIFFKFVFLRPAQFVLLKIKWIYQSVFVIGCIDLMWNYWKKLGQSNFRFGFNDFVIHFQVQNYKKNWKHCWKIWCEKLIKWSK